MRVQKGMHQVTDRCGAGRWKALLAGFGTLAMVCASAHASVAVLLEQPYGKLGFIDTAGHSAIYLDHVCAATPTKLRSCEPGELGVVISRYDKIDHLDWVAMPLMAYLYAAESAEQIPATMDKEQEVAMRDAYRRAHLLSIAPDTVDGQAPEGNWYELAGAAYDRTIYGFSVKSTPEQDERLIAEFNDRRNVERYNGLFVNCADFSRVVLDRFYPHAVRRNFVADLGLTSPKSVARGLAHYAKKHPEVELQVFVVPQVKGGLPRSHEAQDLAEGVVKRLGVPLTVISPAMTAVALVAYVGQGRFAMPKNAIVLDFHEMTTTEFLEPEPLPALVLNESAERVQPEAAMLTAGSVF